VDQLCSWFDELIGKTLGFGASGGGAGGSDAGLEADSSASAGCTLTPVLLSCAAALSGFGEGGGYRFTIDH
jgi:hypothetical protein